jgi:penicillin-insensitive murein endopeptidase
MPPGPHWDLIDASHCYGTQETVDFLSASIETVNTKFPDTPKLAIGHISARSGGHLLPHVSHQAGRDVDLGYYYSGSQAWFTNATVENLDAPRTWALIRTFLTDTDVEMILVDRSVQRILRAYALSIGEDRGWIDSVIQIGGTGATPIVRHARRHRNHMHVRFFSPIAQETGRRLAAILGRKGLIPRPTNYVSHKARKGETLAVLAHRYGTSIGLIAQSNGIQGGRVQIGRVYRIPRAASVSNDQSPVLVPPRAVPSAAFHPN